LSRKQKLIIQIFIFINYATTFRRRPIVAQERLVQLIGDLIDVGETRP